MAEPRIELEHVLGVRELSNTAQTLDDVLAQHGIPRTMVQSYFARGNELTPVPSWTALDDVPGDVDRIVLRALRNTLFETILPWSDAQGLPKGTTGTGFEALVTDANGNATRQGTTLDAATAKTLVSNQVAEFVSENEVESRGCVFGVSGGGDSNALAFGLADAIRSERLTAFTLAFADVMTEAAADRASVLCQSLGIEHHAYSAEETATLLGMSTSLDELYSDFQDAFGGEALHFFGTFLILRAARVIAGNHQFSDLAFGYNREDLLAELLFMLMNGREPLAYPVRQLGEQRIIMPVWRSPKLLLDACHPAFSLENYRERDPHTTRQRSLAFYLGHALDSAYPSFGMSMLEGCRAVFSDRFGALRYESELDLYVTDEATPTRMKRVSNVLRKHFGMEP